MSKPTATLKDVQECRHTVEEFTELVERLGYRRRHGGQLIMNNGSEVSSLLDFLEDNSDAIAAMLTWIEEEHPYDREGEPIPEEGDTDEEEEEEEEDDTEEGI